MELDSEMNDSNMDLEKHVDVIRKYNDGNLYSAFIIENQSYVDMSMVVRAAVYEFVAYERMLKKSKKNKSKEKTTNGAHSSILYRRKALECS